MTHTWTAQPNTWDQMMDEEGLPYVTPENWEWLVYDERENMVARDQDEKTARLIAAAPELLEAAKSTLRFFRTIKIDRDRDLVAIEALDAIRAAIAKAEGKQ